MSTCFVLACGPSIKEQNLKKIGSNPCVTISNFFVHPDFELLDVRYHIFGNLHDPITNEMGVAWFKECEQKLKTSTKVMVHMEQKKLVESNNLFLKNEVIYWTENGVFPLSLPNQVDTYASISQIALQMGYFVAKNDNINEVIIMGIDHSWVNHVNQSKHFYEESESVLVRMGYNEWFNVHNQNHGEEMERQNLNRLNNIYNFYGQKFKEYEIFLYNGTPNSLVTSLEFKFI
jgi:hypothetical protein